MNTKTRARLDLEIIVGNASAASMQAGESEAQWRETLVALRDYLNGKIADLAPPPGEPAPVSFSNSELRLLHYAVTTNLPGVQLTPPGGEMVNELFALAGKVKGAIRS